MSSRPGTGGGSLGSSSFYPQGCGRTNLASQWPGEFRCQQLAYSLEEEESQQEASFSRTGKISVQRDPEAGIAETYPLSRSSQRPSMLSHEGIFFSCSSS